MQGCIYQGSKIKEIDLRLSVVATLFFLSVCFITCLVYVVQHLLFSCNRCKFASLIIRSLWLFVHRFRVLLGCFETFYFRVIYFLVFILFTPVYVLTSLTTFMVTST